MKKLMPKRAAPLKCAAAMLLTLGCSSGKASCGGSGASQPVEQAAPTSAVEPRTDIGVAHFALNPMRLAGTLHLAQDEDFLNTQSMDSFHEVENARNSMSMPIDMGYGFNTLAGIARGRCVESSVSPAQAGDPTKPDGQLVEFSIQEVDTFSRLKSSLGIAASASLGLGAFGATAAATYYSSEDFNESDYYLLVHVNVVNQRENLTAFRLTGDAYRVLHLGIDGFTKMCGDEFVATRVTGGEFTALLRIGTTSREDRRDMALKISASGITWNAKADISSTFQAISQNHTMEVRILRKGDSGIMPQLGPKELIDYARAFPATVAPGPKSKAWIYSYGTQDYSVIPEYLNRGASDLSRQRQVLETLASEFDSACWGVGLAQVRSMGSGSDVRPPA